MTAPDAASRNLLAGPPDTLLPAQPEPESALAAGEDPADVAARWPAASLAWAELADRTFAAASSASSASSSADGRTARLVESYAYARTGYHRGLDALRRAGWRGTGPVPWSHEPNRGVLRCIAALGRAAEAIGESAEAERCRVLLADCDPRAVAALS